MHLIFLDTEFTSFHRPYLLSVGMVSLDGGHEFYIELDMESEAGRHAMGRASEFVQGPEVLGQWGQIPGATVDLQQMGKLTAQWLSNELTCAKDRGDARMTVVSDYDVDFRLLVELLRRDRSWDLFSGYIHFQDIYPLLSRAQANEAEKKCFEELAITRGLRQHHALADALAMRQGFMSMQKD